MNGSSSYFKLMPSTASFPLLNPTDPSGRSTWWNSWYGIRKANLGLANIDKLVNATQEEKDIENLQREFYESQIMNFYALYTTYFDNKLYSTAFYLAVRVFKLYTKVPYLEHYNSTIVFLIECIKLVDNKVFTKENSNRISSRIKDLSGKTNVDQKKMDGLIEVVKKKNIEYGYSLD